MRGSKGRSKANERTDVHLEGPKLFNHSQSPGPSFSKGRRPFPLAVEGEREKKGQKPAVEMSNNNKNKCSHGHKKSCGVSSFFRPKNTYFVAAEGKNTFFFPNA